MRKSHQNKRVINDILANQAHTVTLAKQMTERSPLSAKHLSAAAEQMAIEIVKLKEEDVKNRELRDKTISQTLQLLRNSIKLIESTNNSTDDGSSSDTDE